MAKASDNQFPSVLFTEQVAKPASPAAGDRRLYFKTDHKLYHVDSAGAEAEVGAGASPAATINAQGGTTYTLQASDNGAVVTLNNASAITVTVPSGLGSGFNCLIVQLGAGDVTLTAGAGATVHQRQSLTKTAGQYAVATLVAYAADTFALSGDLA